MKLQRYTAHRLDGSVIATAETAAAIGDVVTDRCNIRGVAYTFDSDARTAYPFVTWVRNPMGWVGTPHRTHADAIKEVKS